MGSEAVVEREQLDVWQGFAYDILEQKAEERELLEGQAHVGRPRGGDEEGGEVAGPLGVACLHAQS